MSDGSTREPWRHAVSDPVFRKTPSENSHFLSFLSELAKKGHESSNTSVRAKNSPEHEVALYHPSSGGPSKTTRSKPTETTTEASASSGRISAMPLEASGCYRPQTNDIALRGEIVAAWIVLLVVQVSHLVSGVDKRRLSE